MNLISWISVRFYLRYHSIASRNIISVSTTTIDWSSVMKEYISCLDWLIGMKNSLKCMIDCIVEDNLTEIQSCYKIVMRKDFKRINSSGLVNIMSEITEYGMMIRIVWICIILYSSSIEYYYYERSNIIVFILFRYSTNENGVYKQAISKWE